MKGLGRLPATDSRDEAHLMAAHLPRRIPRGSRHWYAPSRPLDQGYTSCCVGFSWAHFLMASPLVTKDGPSGKTIYRGSVRLDEWTENDFEATAPDNQLNFGTSTRAGAKYLQGEGRLSEYVWASDEPTLRAFILLRGPAVVGTDWVEGFGEVDAKGFVQLTGSVIGGHAYLIIGYSEKRKAYRALNSWGESWGERGRFWVRQEDMAELIRRDGEICSALELKV